MFDGNHRRRREVNLSGRRTRRSFSRTSNSSTTSITSAGTTTAVGISDGKSKLLAETRIRTERSNALRKRNHSARSIQKVWRAWSCRRMVAMELSHRWKKNILPYDKAKSNTNTGVEVDSENAWMANLASVLSIRLSPSLLPFLFDYSSGTISATTKEQRESFMLNLIIQFQKTWATKSCWNADILNFASRARLCRRILHFLQIPKESNNLDNNEKINSLIQLLQDLLLTNNNDRTRSILDNSMHVTSEGQGLVLLSKRFQEWFWFTTNDNSISVHVCKILLRIACVVATREAASPTPAQSTIRMAMMGMISAVLLCSEKAWSETSPSWWVQELQICFGVTDDNAAAWKEAVLSSLVHVLDHIGPTIKNGVLLCARDTMQGHEHVLLLNAFSIYSSISSTTSTSAPLSVIRLLDHALRSDETLATLLSMAAASGEEITNILSLGDDDTSRRHGDMDDPASDMDEGNDDDDAKINSFEHTSLPAKATKTASTRFRLGSSRSSYARSDLRTCPKLDQIHRMDWIRVRSSVLARIRKLKVSSSNTPSLLSYVETVDALAKVISSGKILLSLARGIGVGVAPITSKEGGAKSSKIDIETAGDAYISVLRKLLRPCSGLRTSYGASSPLLSIMAFHSSITEWVWERSFVLATKERKKSPGKPTMESQESSLNSLEAIILFCDLFAQRLLAVDDEEFLAIYGGKEQTSKVGVDWSTGQSQRQSSSIVASAVVERLRSVLYELYWTLPVVVEDVTATSNNNISDRRTNLEWMQRHREHRASLLLSGTKLWNSLYERWCRLFRVHPFCEEKSWWFPRLVTKETDDGAVVGTENDVSAMMMAPSLSSRSRRANDSWGWMDEDDDSDDSNNDGAAPMDVTDHGTSVATAASAPNDADGEALASSFRNPKMARILTSIPQALPFDRRVKLFDSLLTADKLKSQDDEAEARRQLFMSPARNVDEIAASIDQGREKVAIRRNALYDDSMAKLNGLGKRLRRKVQVTFINQHGATEAGIDGGGVFKEFLDDLIREAFDPTNAGTDGSTDDGDDDGDDDDDDESMDDDSDDQSQHKVSSPSINSPSSPLFVVSPLETLRVNVETTVGNKNSNSLLSHYEFLGRVLGKAVYESILVEPQFCLPFLNQLLGKQNTLDDLKNLDPEYYRHLSALRRMSAKDIESMELAFELTTTSMSAEASEHGSRTIELVPGGSSITVTKENAIRYVHLVAHRRLNVETAAQTRAFLKGFRDLIPTAWVRLFSAYELQKLISGDDTIKGFDVAGLQQAMRYSGGYHPSQPIIQWLWEVVEEMTAKQQQKFLKFMTSCSRQPLLGFQALAPLPCIQQIRLRDGDNGHHQFDDDDEDDGFMIIDTPGRMTSTREGRGASANHSSNVRLPTSSTCMNLLKLPNYKSKDMLREKLLYAIEAGAGFELS